MAPTTRSGNAKLDADKNGKVKLSTDPESKSKSDGGAAQPEKREQEDGGEERRSKVAKTEADVPTDAVEKIKPGQKESDDEGQGKYKVLEQGLIYFFYRPKVQGADEFGDGKAAKSIDDIQNTHMLLVPIESESSTASIKNAKPVSDETLQKPPATTGDEARKLGVGFRLVRLGKKRLPAPEQAISEGREPGGIGGDSSEAIWAVVSDIGQSVDELSGDMGERRYNTQTRGQRVVGASRPAGRGRYSIMLHEIEPPSNRSVQLVYALSHPSDMGDVQKELGLLTTGAIRLMMRNPTLPQTGQGAPPAGLDEKDRVDLDKKELQHTFGGSTGDGGTRYARPENVELLDREGVELLLTRERYQQTNGGAKQGAGEEQVEALRKKASEEGKKLSVRDVLDELALSSSENPPDAIDGKWI